MAKTTSDSILGVIRKFELVLTRRAVNMLVCEQIRDPAANMPNMVMPSGERHGVTAFLVIQNPKFFTIYISVKSTFSTNTYRFVADVTSW